MKKTTISFIHEPVEGHDDSFKEYVSLKDAIAYLQNIVNAVGDVDDVVVKTSNIKLVVKKN